LIKTDDAKTLKAIYWAINGRVPSYPQGIGTREREAERLKVVPVGSFSVRRSIRLGLIEVAPRQPIFKIANIQPLVNFAAWFANEGASRKLSDLHFFRTFWAGWNHDKDGFGIIGDLRITNKRNRKTSLCGLWISGRMAVAASET
jgi:hypothetical protein